MLTVCAMNDPNKKKRLSAVECFKKKTKMGKKREEPIKIFSPNGSYWYVAVCRPYIRHTWSALGKELQAATTYIYMEEVLI